MPLHPRLSFRGRFGRKQFWLNWLGALLGMALAFILAGVLTPTGRVGAILGAILSITGLIAATWVSLATQVKRWHDHNRSGWMVLLNFVPVLGFITCMVCLGFLRGTRGPNRFDPPGTAAPAPPAADGGEPPVLKTAPPKREISKGRRRALAFGVALVALVVIVGAGFFFISPPGDWAVRRSWVRASLGSPEECQAMAWRYRAGRGLPQDFAQAARWFERAANKGLAASQYDLAVLYFYGLGVPADLDKARPLLEAAVQQNYVPAITLLGLWHETIEPGSPEATTRWEQAAAAGDPWAESLLGSASLARRTEGDGKENLIRGLYWLESARRHGVETVGGLLQHVWATVPAEDLEAVTGEVFGRLENGKPDPLPHEAAAAVPEVASAGDNPPTNTPPATDTATPSDTPPASDTTEKAPAEVQLGDEVLAKVRSLPEYVSVSTLYAEKSQADPSWPASDEGQAVGQYLQRMRSDAQAATLKKGDDGKLTLEYTVGGNVVTDPGVQADAMGNDAAYRQTIITALARNIAEAPRPIKVTEFLKLAGKTEGEGK